MPRPGPRPYECVRRAWHSERHQPIRGSIIQQIFRLVTGAHSPSTKNNREWKEKLPVVVFRAEQIMYSKANSEAEYKNPETLWERVNDAIDTIIRRDVSSETGDLLPPCVEAALYLGCIPVRASRSQRQSNTRSYLMRKGQDPPSTLSPDKSNNDCISQLLPAQTSSHPNYPRPEFAPCSLPVLDEDIRSKFNPLKNVEIKSAPSSGSVYPLYYDNHHPGLKSYMSQGVTENPSYETILDGTPVRTPVAETPIISTSQSQLPHDGTSNRNKDVEAGESDRKWRCDLSLRLGVGSEPCEISERSSGGAGSSSSQEFCFFPSESY